MTNIQHITRFWNRVAKSSGCWEWQGTLTKNGYGIITLAYKHKLAHRFSFELAKGHLPPDKLVCHTCDNRKCVNPAHLFLGTNKDNLQDMYAKGRSSRQQQTHCKHGHEFTPENTLLKRGARVCKECRRSRALAYYHAAVKPAKKLIPHSPARNANAEKIHCKNGHPFTLENTYLERNGAGGFGRRCRECRKADQRKRRETLSAAYGYTPLAFDPIL